MSNVTLLEGANSLILKQEIAFTEMAKIHGAVNFRREASFAIQALQDNPSLLKVASENPDSLKRAILNVAAIGLTLSPVYKYAYLVPRDGKVMLDLSYKGFSQLAIDAKSVKYVQAELVYSKDKFLLRGRGQEPVHERNPFDSDRGELIGAYCIAETHIGDFLVEPMTARDILAIRDRTQAYKAFVANKVRSCPWVSDEGEMFKKTVIRRASKSWPMTDTRESERFVNAVRVFDESESIDFNQAPQLAEPQRDDGEDKIEKMRSMLPDIGRTEDAFLKYLTGVTRRKIESLSDLSKIEVENALTQLNQWAKNKKKEVASENA